MKKVNRPYNAKMVFENLHGVVGKTQCDKVMAAMAADDKLSVKEYGKSKIYWINQVNFISSHAFNRIVCDLYRLCEMLRTPGAHLNSRALFLYVHKALININIVGISQC